MEPREGRPVEVVTDENNRRIEEELLSDRGLRLKEISVRLEIPKTTVTRIIHEHLHMNIVSARWVLRLLSSVQKEHRLTCCQKLLELYRRNQKQVTESTVTGDETMVRCYDPLSKRESMEWRKPGEAPPRKAKVTQSTENIILLDPSTTFGTHEASNTESHPIDQNPQQYRCENIRSHVNVVCCSGCDEQNVEVLCHLRSRVNLIYMQRLNSYRAVNTPQLGYTNQSVNDV